MSGIVSIIVCCYNGEEFIDNCFDCLLTQIYSPLEVVFIDDGSSDNSFNKAVSYRESFLNRGDRLLCFSQDNKGVGAAASLGLLHSTGDYICCFDIDDYLYHDSIYEMVSFLESNPSYDIVRTNGFKENIDGSKSLFVVSEIEKGKTDIFEDILFGRINNWSGSYMVRSSALWEVYPTHTIYESRYGQNLQLLLAVSYGRKAGFIDKPLMEYRFNPSSFTNKDKEYDQKLETILGFKSIRLAILNHLKLDSDIYYRLLEVEYLMMIMDLDLIYDRHDLYKTHYEELKLLKRPDPLTSYYYYQFCNNFIKAYYFRFKSFICRLFSFNYSF